MQICVKNASGLELYMDVELEDTIEIVKIVIEDMAKIPAAQIELSYEGNKLEHGRTLKDYAIQPESTLHLEQAKVIKCPTYKTCIHSAGETETMESVSSKPNPIGVVRRGIQFGRVFTEESTDIRLLEDGQRVSDAMDLSELSPDDGVAHLDVEDGQDGGVKNLSLCFPDEEMPEGPLKEEFLGHPEQLRKITSEFRTKKITKKALYRSAKSDDMTRSFIADRLPFTTVTYSRRGGPKIAF